jgi:hypothetical protein
VTAFGQSKVDCTLDMCDVVTVKRLGSIFSVINGWSSEVENMFSRSSYSECSMALCCRLKISIGLV